MRLFRAASARIVLTNRPLSCVLASLSWCTQTRTHEQGRRTRAAEQSTHLAHRSRRLKFACSTAHHSTAGTRFDEFSSPQPACAGGHAGEARGSKVIDDDKGLVCTIKVEAFQLLLSTQVHESMSVHMHVMRHVVYFDHVHMPIMKL